MAREIALFWIPLGLEPKTAYNGSDHPREWYDTLKKAVDEALGSHEERLKEGKLPWIRAGAGDGSHLFNISGIRLLSDAYDEGFNAPRP